MPRLVFVFRYVRDLAFVAVAVLGVAAGVVAVAHQLDLQEARQLAAQELTGLQNEVARLQAAGHPNAQAAASLQGALATWSQDHDDLDDLSAQYGTLDAQVAQGLNQLGVRATLTGVARLVPDYALGLPGLKVTKPAMLAYAAVAAAVVGATMDAALELRHDEPRLLGRSRAGGPVRQGAVAARRRAVRGLAYQSLGLAFVAVAFAMVAAFLVGFANHHAG